MPAPRPPARRRLGGGGGLRDAGRGTQAGVGRGVGGQPRGITGRAAGVAMGGVRWTRSLATCGCGAASGGGIRAQAACDWRAARRRPGCFRALAARCTVRGAAGRGGARRRLSLGFPQPHPCRFGKPGKWCLLFRLEVQSPGHLLRPCLDISRRNRGAIV